MVTSQDNNLGLAVMRLCVRRAYNLFLVALAITVLMSVLHDSHHLAQVSLHDRLPFHNSTDHYHHHQQNLHHHFPKVGLQDLDEKINRDGDVRAHVSASVVQRGDPEQAVAAPTPPLLVPSPPTSQEEPVQQEIEQELQHRGEAVEHEEVHQQDVQEKVTLGQDHQTQEDQKDEDGQGGNISEAHRRGTPRGHRDGNRRLRTGSISSHAASSSASSGGSRHAVDKETIEDHHQNRVTQSDKDMGISKPGGEEVWESSSLQLQPQRTGTRSGIERSEYKSSLEQHVIFKNGDVAKVDGGEPVSLIYSHMAMLELLPDGRLVAAWQGSGIIEGATDQRIYLSYSKDKEGKRWEQPTSMPESLREAGQWSPVLHADPKGQLWVFYAESSTACLRRTIRRPGRAVVPQRWAVGGHIKAMLRYPDGTWGEPRVLYDMSMDAGIPKVVANKLSVLSSGEWVLPFWRQRSYQVCETNKEFNSVGVLISRNEGATWAAHGALHLRYQSHWVIEGTVMEMSNRTLLMLLRSSEGFIYHSLSANRGRTWSALQQTSIMNPDSKIHGIRLSSGEMALSYNDHARAFTGMQRGREGMKRREKLLLALSRDNGATWNPVARLDVNIKSELRNYMMFHYPTLLQRDDTLFIAYSRTYLDRNVAPRPLAVDGIWLAKVNLSQLHVPGPPVPLFDPRACKTTACLLNKGIAGAGPPQGGSEEVNSTTVDMMPIAPASAERPDDEMSIQFTQLKQDQLHQQERYQPTTAVERPMGTLPMVIAITTATAVESEHTL
eukprot:CAMPEP_0118927538 /NCGR_PEP_ID=MMETSP1169-20130426/4979_1 /TAXON_ID=36882 /ORGANISM="Pyramimonas obovata, Strain CCMP722" /LENGTH=777 /DNA_ID=CAMNT_0006869307 /DNA_START=190 /DNA_END=2524 /DNA_ORIENTATION=+